MKTYFIYRTHDQKIMKSGFKLLWKASDFLKAIRIGYPLLEYEIGTEENGIKIYEIEK